MCFAHKYLAACSTAAFILLFYMYGSVAAPVPAFNLDGMMDRSDVVAVVVLQEEPSRFKVIAVYKGKGTTRGDIIQIADNDVAFLSDIEADHPVCMFLRQAVEKPVFFTLTNPLCPFFYVLHERPSVDFVGKDAIEAELIRNLGADEDLLVTDAVLWLETLGGARGREILIQYANKKSTSAAIHAYNLAITIPAGQRATVEDALKFIGLTPTNRPMAKLHTYVIGAFKKITTTDDVQFLNSLLVDGRADIVTALLFSSRKWATNTSIPFLVQALKRTDIDKEGQLRCILCLGILANRPTPSHKEFMADPAKYVSEWQAWAGTKHSAPN
jgi:hypothetical protein